VDDDVYVQPLYVSQVKIPGAGTHNVLYVATSSATIYAFDADDPGLATPLWRTKLLGSGARPVTNAEVNKGCPGFNSSGNIGVVGTPVIDVPSRTLYVVTSSKEPSWVSEATMVWLYAAARVTKKIAGELESGGSVYETFARINIANSAVDAGSRLAKAIAYQFERRAEAIERSQFFQRLHALDIATGIERRASPVLIEASVEGTGRGSSNGVLAFNPKIQHQTAALLLADGVVYITWASHCDLGDYHGWLMGYDKKTLAQVLVKVTTPNGERGASGSRALARPPIYPVAST
jgi:hypothetical protein